MTHIYTLICTFGRVVISYVFDGITHNFLIVDVRFRADLSE